MAKFHLYRKAFAALLVAAIGVAATFIPGIESVLSPTEIQIGAGVLAALAVAVTADKLDGASVVELARLVVDALDRAAPDPDDPNGGTAGVADKAVMRAGDPAPLLISATPIVGSPGAMAVAAAQGVILPKGGAA